VTASASSFPRFRVVDYTTAKHGVLGSLRGIVPQLQAHHLPIRCNAVSPGWTETGIVPSGLLQASKIVFQTPEVVTWSVALLLADTARQGQMICSRAGEFWEVEENVLLKVVPETVVGVGDDEMVWQMLNMRPDDGSHGSWMRLILPCSQRLPD